MNSRTNYNILGILFLSFLLLCSFADAYNINYGVSKKILSKDGGLNNLLHRRRDMIVSLVSGGVFVASSPLSVYANDESSFLDGPRGLKYQVVKEGNANSDKPQRAQKVKASYTLSLNGFIQDGGKLIDTSKQNALLGGGDKPFEFIAGVSQVIKGWDLAIMDMKEGEMRKLIVLSDLGYGDKGVGFGKIPGGSTLFFEVELTEIGEKVKIGPEQQKWLDENPI